MFSTPGSARRRLFWLFMGIVLIELCLIGGAVSLRPALRAIPGRYRSRLPEFVQQLAAPPHAAPLPTPELEVTFALPTFPVTPPTITNTPRSPTRTP